jgi:hypothetical protein
MTSQEMMRTNCGKGKHFENIAAIDEPQNWIIVDGKIESIDDYNHPYTLFGYGQKEFLAKQYK